MQPWSIFLTLSCWMLKCGYKSLKCERFCKYQWNPLNLMLWWQNNIRFKSKNHIYIDNIFFIFINHFLQEGLVMWRVPVLVVEFDLPASSGPLWSYDQWCKACFLRLIQTTPYPEMGLIVEFSKAAGPALDSAGSVLAEEDMEDLFSSGPGILEAKGNCCSALSGWGGFWEN